MALVGWSARPYPTSRPSIRTTGPSIRTTGRADVPHPHTAARS